MHTHSRSFGTILIASILLALCLTSYITSSCAINKRVTPKTQNQKNKKLFDAIDDDTLAIAATALENGANLHAMKDGLTPLHRVKSAEMAHLLIHAKASVNAQSYPSYQTPLHTHRENPALVHVLLAHKADVHAKDAYGNTPLYACNSVESISAFIEAGAAIDARYACDRTVLHSPTLTGEALSYLLTLGAQALIHCRDQTTATPLHRIAWGTEALHKTQWHDTQALELLIAHNACIDAQDGSGDTPLHNARDGAVAHVLIRHSADVNAVNQTGNTPLHTARHPEVVNALLENGSLSLEQQNSQGLTPLHKIASQTFYMGTHTIRALCALITHDAHTLALHKGGRTVLQSIVRYSLSSIGNPSAFKQLIRLLLQKNKQPLDVHTISCLHMQTLVIQELKLDSLSRATSLPYAIGEIIQGYAANSL